MDNELLVDSAERVDLDEDGNLDWHVNMEDWRWDAFCFVFHLGIVACDCRQMSSCCRYSCFVVVFLFLLLFPLRHHCNIPLSHRLLLHHKYLRHL